MLRPDPRIQIVLDRLTAEADPISLKELSRSVNLSASRFSHLFALATGLTPGRYMKRRKQTRSPESRRIAGWM